MTAVVLPLVLAAVAAAWLAWQVDRIASVAEWIDNSDRVIALAAETGRLMVDQEMALRAFLSGDEAALERYQEASPEEDLQELQELVEQRAQVEKVRWLRWIHQGWSMHAEEAIANVSGWSDAARQARAAELDELRAVGAALVQEEKATRLAHVRRFEEQTATTTLGAVGLLALIAAAASSSSHRQIRLIVALARRERQARERAEEALRAKDAFLVNLSHELRTPLTPILAWVGILRTKRARDDVLDRGLALIEKCAKTETRIVDDLLDISRITAGKLHIVPETVDPAAAVRAAVDVTELSAQAKGVAIQARISSPLPMVLGDPERIHQVVCILLGNAVKFTPRGGHVEILADRSDGEVRIRVTDDGEGIPADFLPHVFESFCQADTSMKRAHGGLGLGLAIAKHVVEMHGGGLTVDSEGPSRGATFTLTLPARDAVPGPR